MSQNQIIPYKQKINILQAPKKQPVWLMWVALYLRYPWQITLSLAFFAFLGHSIALSNVPVLREGSGVSSALFYELYPDNPIEKRRPKPVRREVIERPKNKFAPVNGNELPQTTTARYIQQYARIAQATMRDKGIPASISLAQGLIESRAGTSKLAVSNNNHFGMKCFSKSCRKGHCTNFTDDSHKDFFLKFSSALGSWKAHAELLTSSRYQKLRKYGRDYKKWAYGLKSIGYATDRTYAEKLIKIIQDNNLGRFDR